MKKIFPYIKPLSLVFVLSIMLTLPSCGQSNHSFSQSQLAKEKIANNNPYYSRTDIAKLHVSKATWKKILSSEMYAIAFEKGTEQPFKNQYWNYKGTGTYYCAVCGNKLFYSTAKFASECGWPSFFKPVRKGAVIYTPDHSYGMSRTEVTCARCGAHLGHVFNDGPKPTGLRYCMNSAVLEFVPDAK